MCGVVKLSIGSLAAHTAGHGLDRDVGRVRPSVWVQRVPTSNRTRTSPARQSRPKLALVLSDCSHWFSNVACCKQ